MASSFWQRRQLVHLPAPNLRLPSLATCVSINRQRGICQAWCTRRPPADAGELVQTTEALRGHGTGPSLPNDPSRVQACLGLSAGNLGGKRRKRVGYRDGTQTALVSPEEENAGTRGGHRPTACWSGAFGRKGRRPRGLTETRPRGQVGVRRASPLGSVRPATSFRPRRRSSVRPSALSLPTADFGKMEFRARLKSEERKDGS